MKISQILVFLNDINVEYSFSGNDSDDIEGFSSLTNYGKDTFTWIKNVDSLDEEIDLTKISLVFSRDKIEGPANVIITQYPKAAFFSVIEHFYGKEDSIEPIGHNTYISSSVTLGDNVRIGHNCSIDGKIIIGDNTRIGNNVSIVGKVEIGRDCYIQSGVVIGHESVSYSEDDNHIKTLLGQYGGVRIGNNVRIQPQCNIARGSLDDTVIMDGAIIGEGSEVAHNCHIGENVALLPYGILCGSVVVGDNSYISAACVKNQIKIGKNAYIGFGSVVVKDVADGEEVWGFPARRIPIKRD